MTTIQADRAETQYVDGVSARFAYRRIGPRSGVPLIMAMRFRGTLDHWYPALLDVLGSERDVIVFDNVGTACSSGTAPTTIEGPAQGLLEFIGDVIPVSGLGRLLVVSQAALGSIFLALVISYVPVFYQAFSRRELRSSLLDARAGTPPTAVELLRRNGAGPKFEELRLLLHKWEGWCVDLLESHLSYPVLAYYRSQHEQQSWVKALTVNLDTCVLFLTCREDAP